MEDRWDDKASNAKGKQTRGRLRNSYVEKLLGAIDATQEKRHAEDQK
jgi:hypothetical protein